MTAAGREHPFAALVRERGGLALASYADVPSSFDDAGFVCVLARGEEIVPPVARLEPVQAAAWLVLSGEAEAKRAEAGPAAQALAEGLERRDAPAFLLTAGRVGGSGDAASFEITVDLVARVLDAAIAGEVEWERDPDFGYELPMELPGLAPDDRRVLVPRFLYARTDRVYDYAAMVPAIQRERHARLVGVVGVASAVADAVAPPARGRR